MLSRLTRLNPWWRAAMEYRPGWSSVNWYPPLSFVVASRFAPVSRFVIVTWVFGIMARLESKTNPLTPADVWPNAWVKQAIAAANTKLHGFRIESSSPGDPLDLTMIDYISVRWMSRLRSIADETAKGRWSRCERELSSLEKFVFC